MSFGAVPQVVILPQSPFEALNEIVALLDAAEPKVRRRFLELVNGANALDDLEEVADLLERGQIAEALAVTDEIAPGLSTALETAYTAAGLSAAQVLRSQTPTLLDFDPTNARAVASVARTRARLIREFTQQQREATTEMLADAFARGLAPIDQARVLKQSIGLTGKQAQSVVNFRRLLETNSAEALTRKLRDRRFDPTIRRAIRDGTPLSAAQVDRMVDRYRDRFVAFRARTIARTETLRAINEGDEELWNQAVEAGVIDRDDIKNVWHTAGDERVRSSHRFMNGQARMLGVPFRSGNGNNLRFPGDPAAPGSDTINCRCVVAREVKKVNRGRIPKPIAG